MANPDFQIKTLTELRELIGQPSDISKHKQHDALDEHAQDFIAASPFLVLSTNNQAGLADASPKGDAPGFVRIVDAKTMLIPDRPGNRRADSLSNILEQPQVGLLFFIPGMRETLRVNGLARITANPEVLHTMVVNQKIPQLAIEVSVTEVFLHCGKALIRSKLWQSKHWPAPNSFPSGGTIFQAHIPENQELTVDQAQEILERDYRDRLY